MHYLNNPSCSSKMPFQNIFQVETIAEISGAFGDMGTLLPILVSLSVTNQVNLTASLVFGGLFNIISGLYFGIPMCVQPMKSIAAIALLSNMNGPSIAAAGLTVALALIFFSLTGLMKYFNKYIPLYIIRGIQLGTGLSLISKGITSILSSKGWVFAGYAWSDNFIIAMLSFLVIMVCWRAKWSFSALFLFVAGIVISSTQAGASGFTWGPKFMAPFFPNAHEWWIGFSTAGLGQIPLTVSNSVIAVSVLATDLFPEKQGRRTDVTSISLWIAFMNIVGVCFGSLPYCCGSGGLAAQYRFGARSGTSIVFLGAVKMVSGLVFGNSLLDLFKFIPKSIIGVLLVVAGLQIALITVNLGSYKTFSKREDAYLCMVLTAASIVGFANDGIGFLIGCVAALILHYTSLDVKDIVPEKLDTAATVVAINE
ncbi:hypothetical protein HDV03_004327 [Kappamyces sp. JEL0829]|nr:hypothetical protein HDV03_004327 [Kappamyces sp. JEL0829]